MPFSSSTVSIGETTKASSHNALLNSLDAYLDQAVRTTDSPTFAAVNTGQGANELYAMNQNVRTTDDVSFNKISKGASNPYAGGGGIFVGMYAGSTTGELTLPIGAIILGSANVYMAPNTLVVTSISGNFYYVRTSSPVGSALTGTWRSRGCFQVDTVYYTLAQRVS